MSTTLSAFPCVGACDVKRLRRDLQQETAARMNSDVMMERVLIGDIVVIVNIIVLTAQTSSIVVSFH